MNCLGNWPLVSLFHYILQIFGANDLFNLILRLCSPPCEYWFCLQEHAPGDNVDDKLDILLEN